MYEVRMTKTFSNVTNVTKVTNVTNVTNVTKKCTYLHRLVH